MRIRILEAAKQEFAAPGLAGARSIASRSMPAPTSACLYYHVGNKEDLYLEVLEGAYEKIRAYEARASTSNISIPPEAIERLIDFTWNTSFAIRNPGAAQYRKHWPGRATSSARQGQVDAFAVRRDDRHPWCGAASRAATFAFAVVRLQLYISIAGLCFFYLSNSATLSVIFGRDLLKKERGTSAFAIWQHWCWRP